MKKLPRKSRRPEDIIQRKIIKKLRYEGWFVKPTHGNIYVWGFPDLYCTHSSYGIRWVEVKLPEMVGSEFTQAQLEEFPKFCANGSGIWILTGDSEDEYERLFKPYNWHLYLALWKG